MPRFAANLSMLFTEVPFLERFDRAARAGFQSVEVQFPYEATAPAVRDRLVANRLTMVLHNLPAGDWSKGDRGIACNPQRVDEFRAGVAKGAGVGAFRSPGQCPGKGRNTRQRLCPPRPEG